MYLLRIELYEATRVYANDSFPGSLPEISKISKKLLEHQHQSSLIYQLLYISLCFRQVRLHVTYQEIYMGR